MPDEWSERFSDLIAELERIRDSWQLRASTMGDQTRRDIYSIHASRLQDIIERHDRFNYKKRVKNGK